MAPALSPLHSSSTVFMCCGTQKSHALGVRCRLLLQQWYSHIGAL